MQRQYHRAKLAAFAVVAALAFAALAGLAYAARQVPPVNGTPPTISGTAQQGQTLTANAGTWTGTAPITFTYQWQRCNRRGEDCANISGADDRTYTLRGVDVGNTIRVRVTGTNRDGSSSANSAVTPVVTRSTGQAGCPSGTGGVNVTALAPPARLTVDGQSIAPNPVGRTTRSLTVRFRVSCGGRPVQGALVYAAAVPFNQFSVPPEQSTGADGWAQLSMTRLGGFPAARRQRLLVVFVRARKQGENVLGGISTRRLVSFRVNLSQ
jgi:hypothetical protein